MTEVGMGVKAGVVSGVIYGMVNTIVTIIVMGVILPSVFPGFFGAMAILAVLLIVGLFTGVIIGFFFGLIFAVLYKELPGRTSVVKGVVFSIVPWGVLALTLQLAISPEWQPPEVRPIVSVFMVISLATSILWGILIGYFWDRFNLKSQVE